MATPLDEAKAFLLKTNANGLSLHDHLSEVFHKILEDKYDNALDIFENLSLQVKQTHFTPDVPVTKEPNPDDPATEIWYKNNNGLFKKSVTEDEEAEGTHIPNVMEEMSFFEWAGVGLSREEAYRLFLSMYRLQTEKKLKTVRFFGKILGTAKDYYVVEAQYQDDAIPEPEEGEEEAPKDPKVTPAEDRGQGCNTYTYFVANDVGEPWTELPAVLPQQVAAARLIKKYFTGDLNADVSAYPPFPGKEREYLRVQISRIVHGTYLAPAGMFQPDPEVEEEPIPIIPTEEFEGKSKEEMMELDGWVHYPANIMKMGRATKPPPAEEEGEEGEEAKEEEEGEPEEDVPSLNAISSDTAIKEPKDEGDEGVLAWSTRVYCTQGSNYSVCMAKSYRWPGAYSAAVLKPSIKFANIYIGYGHKETGAAFTPQPPPAIMKEAEDVEEAEDMEVGDENKILREMEEKRLEEEAAEDGEAEE